MMRGLLQIAPALALVSCGGEAGSPTLGTYDDTLTLKATAVRCNSGTFIGDITPGELADGDPETPNKPSPVERVQLYRWDVETAIVQYLGEAPEREGARSEGLAWRLDADSGPACDGPGKALLMVPTAEGRFGRAVTVEEVRGVIKGGRVDPTTNPAVITITLGGTTATGLVTYIHDLGADEALMPVTLMKFEGDRWDALWPGSLTSGFVLGAIARDVDGNIVGTLGL